jgi:DNA-binding NtrC family response regulator
VFEQADQGTLLIDEIGDLDLALQPKLLRALERGEVKRVGSSVTRRVDVRIIAATRRDLDHEVQAGRFRDDLFHRLAVARVELPPLRNRKGDVAYLAAHFCSKLAGDERSLPGRLLPQWEDSPWPGNVRELRNAVARWIALGDPDAAGTEDPGVAEAGTSGDFVSRLIADGLPILLARERMVGWFHERYIEHVLAQHGGDVGQAAAASGIARRHFNRLRARARK